MATARKGRVEVSMRRPPFPVRDEPGEGESTDYKERLKKNGGWLAIVGFLLLATLALFFMTISGRRQVVAIEQERRLLMQTATLAVKVLPSPGSLLPGGTASPVVTSTISAQGTPTVVNLAAEEAHPVSSGQFPGETKGPAIVQWWDGNHECGIFRLPEGETFRYDGMGTWWQFASEAAVDSRYPSHRTEYFDSNQDCNEGKPEE